MRCHHNHLSVQRLVLCGDVVGALMRKVTDLLPWGGGEVDFHLDVVTPVDLKGPKQGSLEADYKWDKRHCNY